MKILITGGTGYIGQRLVQHVTRSGHEALVFSRSQPRNLKGVWISYDLNAAAYSQRIPDGIEAIIHLAANPTDSRDFNSENEMAAARRLLRLAVAHNAKFVFVSSQTARVDAPTEYGRIKWRIEQMVYRYKGYVVRPGLVYGGELKGLFGKIVRMTKTLPILPRFLPSPLVQPIHLDDLCDGLIRLLSVNHPPPRLYCLAAASPRPFSEFLSSIADSRLRKWRALIPTPSALILLISQINAGCFERRIGLTQLRSLFDLPIMETSEDLSALGITLRTLESGMQPSGSNHRRTLLLEGRALLQYLLKGKPRVATLVLYVRAIEKMRSGASLGLPRILTKFPILLSSLDTKRERLPPQLREFHWRLDAATLLAECTTHGAKKFLGNSRGGPILALLRIFVSVLQDRAFRLVWSVCRSYKNRWICALTK